jgi:hypothetical protein
MIRATIGAQSAGGGRARSKTSAPSTLHHANRLQSKRCVDSAHPGRSRTCIDRTRLDRSSSPGGVFGDMGDTPPSPRARHRSAKSMRGDDQSRDRRHDRPVAAERGRRPQHPRRFITQIDCSQSVAWIPPIVSRPSRRGIDQWWSGINSGPASTAAIDPPVQTGHMGNTPPQGPTASGKPPVDAPG